MEPVSFALGIGGLAGIFTACVDCFEYIQLGRSFGDDYGKCLLRLDAARLRMTRWGAAVGLGAGTQSLRRLVASEDELRIANSCLGQILATFEAAEKESERFKNHSVMKKQETHDLIICDPNLQLESSYKSVHTAMRELARQRQKKSSYIEKTAWALYGKGKFDAMINDINGFISDLVGLFPASVETQSSLCSTETSTIKQTEDLLLLKDVASQDDTILEESIVREIESRGHTLTEFTAKGDSKTRVGDKNGVGVASKSHHVSKFTISDKAGLNIGNVNAGERGQR